jgi:hypothetical protein
MKKIEYFENFSLFLDWGTLYCRFPIRKIHPLPIYKKNPYANIIKAIFIPKKTAITPQKRSLYKIHREVIVERIYSGFWTGEGHLNSGSH